MPPARRVVTRSPHRPVGIIACNWIQNQAVEYESQLERRFVQRALTFPYLTQITHQPFRIAYEDQGKHLEYVPDFLCRFKDGSQIVVEVKPAKFVEKNRIKLNAAKVILGTKDIPLLLSTDKQLNHKLASQNAALILRYARGEILEASRIRCMNVVHHQTESVSLRTLLSEASVSIGDVLHLIGRGELVIQSLDEIHDAIAVSYPKKEQKNDSLLFFTWLDTTPW